MNAAITSYRPKRASLILTEAEDRAMRDLAAGQRFEGNISRAAGWAFRVANIVASADPAGVADPLAALEGWAKRHTTKR